MWTHPTSAHIEIQPTSIQAQYTRLAFFLLRPHCFPSHEVGRGVWLVQTYQNAQKAWVKVSTISRFGPVRCARCFSHAFCCHSCFMAHSLTHLLTVTYLLTYLLTYFVADSLTLTTFWSVGYLAGHLVDLPTYLPTCLLCHWLTYLPWRLFDQLLGWLVTHLPT